MPVSRSQDPYGGRFAVDPAGSSVLAGYQQATNKLDRDLVKRNIKPYKKYGFEQSLNELAGMTDQARYKMATKAVLAKNEVGAKGSGGTKRTTTKTGGSKGGGSSSGGTKKKTTTSKPKQPTAKQQAKAAADKARKAAQAAAKAAAKRATQRKPPKGAAKPKPQPPLKPPRTAPHLPPRAKPTPKPPPLFGRPPVRV